MTRAQDDIRIWIDEAWRIPEGWQWLYPTTLGQWSHFETFGRPVTLSPRDVSPAKLHRLMRMSVIHEPDDFSPMIDIDGMHLIPTDPPMLGDPFTPPPLSAVRSDQLSRLWSRKP